VSFLRVPEIHDSFTWKCFFSRTTTVGDVVESILDTLGLSRSLPVPGGGAVRYVLEEVWAEGDAESEFARGSLHLSVPTCLLIIAGAVTLPQEALFYDLFHSSNPPSTFSAKARRFFRFSVPEEWYRRSRPRPTSSLSLDQSESSTEASHDMGTSEEDGDGDGDGTAKQSRASAVSDTSPLSKVKSDSADWRQSLSQGRLSSVFESWLRPSTPTSPTRTTKNFTPERMSVSEPKLLERTGESDASDTNNVDAVEDDLDMGNFEQMLVSAQLQM
jgi:diaphanous 1